MSAYLSERVAYLRGLSDGLGIKEESAQDKLILKIIDVLQDISDAVDDVQGDMDELNEYVEDMLGRDELVCPECHQVLFEEKEEPTE